MRFACQPGCGKCCSRRGSVYLTEADVVRAAALLGLSAAEFEARHIVRFKRMLRLRKPARGVNECRFLKDQKCSIHAAKPTQCRAYPFWPSLIESKAMWTIEGTFCPGIGQGELVQIGSARRMADEMTSAYPGVRGF